MRFGENAGYEDITSFGENAGHGDITSFGENADHRMQPPLNPVHHPVAADPRRPTVHER